MGSGSIIEMADPLLAFAFLMATLLGVSSAFFFPLVEVVRLPLFLVVGPFCASSPSDWSPLPGLGARPEMVLMEPLFIRCECAFLGDVSCD